MQAIILSIGDELVLGQSIDTNSAFLSSQLSTRGIGTRYHQTVADDLPTITQAIKQASQQAKLVIITGGLGPTDDDLTRQALADAMGQPLIEDPESLRDIAAYFQRLNRTMPDRNRVQAFHPKGAIAIFNTCGTAPGIKAQFGIATIYVTPGVPREMVAMFQKSILPELDQYASDRNTILTTKINTFGMGESTLGEVLGDLMKRDRNPIVGTTVAGGIVSVRIRSEFPNAAEAQRQIDDTILQIEKKLGPIIFGRETQTIADSLITILKSQNKKIATAESCTGGLVGATLTDVSGSSDAYVGGWVTYANEMKQQELGVDPALIAKHGAVSQPVARAMAIGALKKSNADFAISVTGVAGPLGGTPEKPVGTVWIGLACKNADGKNQPSVIARKLQLTGERDQIRDRSVKCALMLLRLILLNQPIEHLSWATEETMPA